MHLATHCGEGQHVEGVLLGILFNGDLGAKIRAVADLTGGLMQMQITMGREVIRDFLIVKMLVIVVAAVVAAVVVVAAAAAATVVVVVVVVVVAICNI